MDNKGYFKKIIKFITDVISWTCLCLLIFIISCIVYYFVCSKIYASKGEKYTPYFSLYTIISPSMEPNIKVYDVILNTRVDDVSDLKVGDVITFISTGSLSNGMTITHRIHDIVKTENGIMFATKGDNNDSPDGALVDPSNILGKTFMKFPQLGRVQFFVANKGGFLLVIVLPALGVIIYDILKLFKNSKLKEKVDKAIEPINDADLEERKRKQQEREAKRKAELRAKLARRLAMEDDILDDE